MLIQCAYLLIACTFFDVLRYSLRFFVISNKLSLYKYYPYHPRR